MGADFFGLSAVELGIFELLRYNSRGAIFASRMKAVTDFNIGITMSNFRKTIAALCLLALAAPSSFAQKQKMQNKFQSMYTASIEFVDLPNSQYDPSFNEASFKEMVADALARSGIELGDKKRGKFHLIFEADYARRVGDVDYRFLTVRNSNRNMQKHSICDVSQTIWWGGPSGAREIPGVAQSSIDAFLKRCISK